MATQNGFSTSTTRLQNACYNDLGHRMGVMGDEIFGLPSFSPDEYNNMQDFCQLDNQFSSNSSSQIMSTPPPHTSSANSAFREYIKADPKAALDFFTPGHILHKRCFRYLRQIQEIEENSLIMSSLASHGNQHKNSKTGSPGRSRFQRMMAERNRRVRLRQLFSYLYSLVPAGSSKTNKHSILANTANYLKHLKLRVAQLEQQTKTLEGSWGFGSHHQPFNSKNTVLYNGDGVVMEECQDIPGQVNLRISVEKDVVSCPPSLISKVVEQLREEQLELISIHSHTEASQFLTKIVVQSKVHQWDTRKWRYFGDMMRCFVIQSCEGEV